MSCPDKNIYVPQSAKNIPQVFDIDEGFVTTGKITYIVTVGGTLKINRVVPAVLMEE